VFVIWIKYVTPIVAKANPHDGGRTAGNGPNCNPGLGCISHNKMEVLGIVAGTKVDDRPEPHEPVNQDKKTRKEPYKRADGLQRAEHGAGGRWGLEWQNDGRMIASGGKPSSH
jgi:hypothetical protein